MQVGTYQQTSGGLVSLDWQEIIAWANHFHKEVVVEMIEHPRHSPKHKRTYNAVVIERCTLVDWELEQIKKLSQEYSSEYSQAIDPNRECPKPIFLDEVSEDDALANSKAIAEGLKMFNVQSGPQVEVVRNE
jgi:hypothetical protein